MITVPKATCDLSADHWAQHNTGWGLFGVKCKLLSCFILMSYEKLLVTKPGPKVLNSNVSLKSHCPLGNGIGLDVGYTKSSYG